MSKSEVSKKVSIILDVTALQFKYVLKVHYATFLWDFLNKKTEFLMQETVVCRS